MYLKASHNNEANEEIVNYKNSNGFTLINPTEDWFPGLNDIKEELKSWSWKYGMTPKFTITRPITLPQVIAENMTINVSVESYHGLVKAVTIKDPEGLPEDVVEFIESDIASGLKGARYSSCIFQEIVNRLRLPKTFMSQSSAV